jgi:hypothetical protein
MKTCQTCQGWGSIPDPNRPGQYQPCPACKPQPQPSR